jgi:ABC-type transporter Mla subunit MlaD
MEASCERTLAGLVAVIGAGLLVGPLVLISRPLEKNDVSHVVYSKFAGGLQPGTPIRFGGTAAGRVQRVRIEPGNSTRIEVRITVERDVPANVDSVARISSLGALPDDYIEISIGSEHAALGAPDSTLKSAEAFGPADPVSAMHR